MNAQDIQFGVDTGGTFTDIVGMDGEGRIHIRKVDNNTPDPTASIADGVESVVRESGVTAAEASRIVHCTTILGNSVIQRVGPVCGLITTKGFRDVLELGRQHNAVLYDIFWTKTPPLVPRRRCLEVNERLAADGGVIEPLDMASVDAAIDRLIAMGAASAAICLINACTNPAHECAVAARIAERCPDMTVSVSSDVSPEWGEYERTSTTVTDAFVKPTFIGYIGALQNQLASRGMRPKLYVMQSAGSIVPAARALTMPVHSLDSGPAAAVVASAALGRALGYLDIVTLEIGGTTAKSTIIEGGEPKRARESEIGTPVGSDGRSLRGGGYALRMPVIDAVEVGAGGGSIARVDAPGSLSVGPQGAGAYPGPASYGRGGELPTLTDANLVLGYLSDDHLLGGTIRLDRRLAETALERHVAQPLGLPLLEAAHTVRALANAIVARAVRAVSTERGRDIRRYALLAAGGGGPGHAAEIARSLGVGDVVIPPYAGLFAALGMLWSPQEQRASKAMTLRLDKPTALQEIETVLSELREPLVREIGADRGTVVREGVDVHYVGQFHDLTIPIERVDGRVSAGSIRGAFEEEHERTFGYSSAREVCEIRAVRVLVRQPGQTGLPPMLPARDGTAAQLPRSGSTRKIYFGAKLGPQRARIFRREDLSADPVQGPIVIPEYDTTVVVPPDYSARRTATGALVLSRLGGGS